jgi:hypothetical protein
LNSGATRAVDSEVKSHRDLWFCRGFGACLVLALALVLWIAFAQ